MSDILPLPWLKIFIFLRDRRYNFQVILSIFSFSVNSPEILGTHIKQLLGEAEMRLQELGGGHALLEEPSDALLNTRASFSSIIGSAYPASAMTGKKT